MKAVIAKIQDLYQALEVEAKKQTDLDIQLTEREITVAREEEQLDVAYDLLNQREKAIGKIEDMKVLQAQVKDIQAATAERNRLMNERENRLNSLEKKILTDRVELDKLKALYMNKMTDLKAREDKLTVERENLKKSITKELLTQS